MLIFDHIGLTTDEKKPDEFFYAPNKVWITDSERHPFKIEWLRYESDSPVQGKVRTQAHVAYRVDSIDKAAVGMRLLLGPMIVDERKRVAFYETGDGAVIELMEVGR